MKKDKFSKSFPSLNDDNSATIIKAENVLIRAKQGEYWERSEISKNCVDKDKLINAIISLEIKVRDDNIRQGRNYDLKLYGPETRHFVDLTFKNIIAAIQDLKKELELLEYEN